MRTGHERGAAIVVRWQYKREGSTAEFEFALLIPVLCLFLCVAVLCLVAPPPPNVSRSARIEKKRVVGILGKQPCLLKRILEVFQNLFGILKLSLSHVQCWSARLWID